jgi:hypothetical protein
LCFWSCTKILPPVDFYGGEVGSPYKKGLLRFKERRQLEDDWVETLARIEFRGRRPETEDEWEAIYGVLRPS